MNGDRPSFDELTLGRGASLEELVERQSLEEMMQSFFELFRIPLRVYTREGKLLADGQAHFRIHEYLDGFAATRSELRRVIDAVKSMEPSEDDVSLRTFLGTIYRVVALQYDGRHLGRLVLGPFLGATAREVPPEVLALDATIDGAKVIELLQEVPRAGEETVSRIARHLRKTLDLILFSGHKALLTSNMHLATVRASYGELADKTQRLQEAYDRLKELDRLKSSFLATVSHELRTPLTSIIGYSEMLAEGIAGELNPDQTEFVHTIQEKGEQLLELIKGLLDMSKLESGTMAIRRRRLDPTATLRDVVDTLAPAARKKGVDLSLVPPDGPLTLWGDPARLRQIFLNLTENALKFTPSGGLVELAAQVVHRTPDQVEEDGLAVLGVPQPMLELRVADTGPGIPPAEREKVFDAFYQVDSSSTREQGGTGLGLSIVKRLVEAHEGSVRIESNNPQGALFIVTLPIRKGADGESGDHE